MELVAKALNSGDMARATMTAVLMRLPDPGEPFRIAGADRELVKAGFNPDEPRDEQGRWTDEGGTDSKSEATMRDPRTQLAEDGGSDAFDDPVAQAAARAAAAALRDIDSGHSLTRPANSEYDNLWDALGSRLSHDVKSALSRIGEAQISESDADLALGTAEANAVMSALSAFAHYRARLWPDSDGHTVQVPILDTAPAVDEGGATIGRPLLPPSAPLMRPRTNADWIDPLINLLSLGVMGTGAAVRLARPAAEVADALQASTNAEHAFETTESVTVAGSRAIDRGASYESVVRRMYGDTPLSQRGFGTSVDGKEVIGRADNTTTIDGKLTAVEAKYVDTWTTSLRNPASNAGGQPWGLTEQQQMVRQAKAYASGFPGGVVYHTNSVDLATYYTQVFRRAGIMNFRFVITPATRLSKTMPRNYMERIFGEGAFEYERKIAGTRPGEDATVRYVCFDDPASISDLFYEVLGKIQPSLMKSGGAVLEGTRLTLPDGRRFFAIVFHDDLDGWRQQIERGASELGRATARVLDGNVIVSDGQSYPLSNCEAEFD